MGTHNRLLRLGPETYLEVIAIDPTAKHRAGRVGSLWINWRLMHRHAWRRGSRAPTTSMA
uniref:VOC family protein n=1 Tax=Pseudomonas sp. TH31 TaxID=2796396 RepID=UPI001F5BAFC6|nr:VOC family protein [Pseudomonas sp. TH31]